MISRFMHTAISTPDVERLAAFYCDALGFEVVLRSGWEESAPHDELLGVLGSASALVMLRAPGSSEGDPVNLELFEFRSPEPPELETPRPPHHYGIFHICLAVTDLENEYERLRRLGMTFHARPTRLRDILVVYGRDPDGNQVELIDASGI